MRVSARRFLCLSASALALSPALAQAQPASSATAPPANASSPAETDVSTTGASDTPGEIVVTALKRSTTVQNTPVAITALTDKSLANLGATSIADIVRTVPGLNLIESDSGRTRISIRGIQTAGESTVGLYYGETPLTGPSGTGSDPSGATPNLNLFDVERVEVLRGPQGTLYGSGSMGGTLRVLFKQPNLTKYEGASEFQLSDVKNGGLGYFAKGAVNAPIVEDMLAARLILYREQVGGYVDNITLNDKNDNRAVLQGGRFLVEFKPSTNLQFNAMALLQTQKIDGTSQWEAALGPYKGEIKVKQPWYDKLQLYNLNTKWDIGFATLTMANSHYKWNVESTNDNTDNYASVARGNAYCGLYQNTAPGSLLQRTSPGATGAAAKCTTTVNGITSAQQLADYAAYAASVAPIGAYQPRYVTNWTNELRISSNGTGKLGYTLGIFREDRDDRVDTLVFPAVAATGEMRQPVIDLGSRYIVDSVKQTAEFGEVSYKILPTLTVTAGLRHYHYVKTVGGAYLGYNYFNGQTPRGFISVSANADGFIKKGNVEWHPTRNIMSYFTYSEGFRVGGANNIPGLPIENSTYKPDRLKNYEVGVKTQWLDRRLTLNLAAYRIDWTNLQTSVQATYGNFSFIDNIGAARIEGIEAETSLVLIPGLILNGSFNYNNPRLTADQVSSQATAPGKKGDKLALIPHYSGSAGVEYNFPVFGDFKGLVRADYTYTGKFATQLRPTNVNYRVIGDYSQVNARIGFQNTDFGLFLFVNNISNSQGINSVSAAAGTPDYYVSQRPRTIGLNMRKSF